MSVLIFINVGWHQYERWVETDWNRFAANRTSWRVEGRVLAERNAGCPELLLLLVVSTCASALSCFSPLALGTPHLLPTYSHQAVIGKWSLWWVLSEWVVRRLLILVISDDPVTPVTSVTEVTSVTLEVANRCWLCRWSRPKVSLVEWLKTGG